jgi:large subunit ribosomal protein L24
MKRIKKGDFVIIVAGKSKGMKGTVLKVLVNNRVLVSGVNMVKKHVKPNPSLQVEGGIVEKEASLHISNIALLNPNTQKADRVGFKFVNEEGSTKLKKIRYFKSNGEAVESVQ